MKISFLILNSLVTRFNKSNYGLFCIDGFNEQKIYENEGHSVYYLMSSLLPQYIFILLVESLSALEGLIPELVC